MCQKINAMRINKRQASGVSLCNLIKVKGLPHALLRIREYEAEYFLVVATWKHATLEHHARESDKFFRYPSKSQRLFILRQQ